MEIDEQARERLAQQRQDTENLQDTMLTRAEEQVQASDDSALDEQARKKLAEQRQHDEHIQDTMLHRSEEQLSQ